MSNRVNRERVNPVRTVEEICRDVLEGCKYPIIQSRLSTKANISSTNMFRRYTDPMIEEGLLSLSIRKPRRTEREFFSITASGQRALMLIDKHLEIVPRGITNLDKVLQFIDKGELY